MITSLEFVEQYTPDLNIQSSNFTLTQLLHIIHLAIKEIEQYRRLSGPQKKEFVMDVARLVYHLFRGSNEMHTFIYHCLDTVIDEIIHAANNGKKYLTNQSNSHFLCF